MFQGVGWRDVEFPSLFNFSGACDLSWSEVLSWIQRYLVYVSNTWLIEMMDYAHVVIQDLGALRVWDPGIRLRVRLQSDMLLRSMAGIVFSLGYRATCRCIWDFGIDCLRTNNFKEGRFVISPFGTLEILKTHFI